MPASKNKPFLFDHCWKLLKNCEKWKLRDQETKKMASKVDDDDDEEVEEVKRARAVNYTVVEDEALIKAWESISLDSIHGTDQTGKRYWQRVEDKFFQLMPRNATTVPRTFRSLQSR